MTGTNVNSVDPSSGYCFRSKTYLSLRPKAPIPPPSLPISLTDFLLLNPRPHSSFDPTTTPFLIDSSTDRILTYSDFLSLSNSLSLSLRSLYPSLSKSDVAFILSPNSLHLPLLYFALLSLGVILSPASPLGSPSDIDHQLLLTRPSIAFATSETSRKLPKERFPLGIVLIDSPEFSAMMTEYGGSSGPPFLENVNGVVQSDTATILYSSGTTGRVKGVVMSHRSMIGGLSHSYNPSSQTKEQGQVVLLPLPLFHVYGMFMVFGGFARGRTIVLLTEGKKFEVGGMLRMVDRYKVNELPASPPVVVEMVKLRRGEEKGKKDMRSLMMVRCGGAPLGKEVSLAFQAKFPSVMLSQVLHISPSL